MRNLNFPTYPFNIKRDTDKVHIFDIIRKKWYVLTHEEWVRQHVIWFLVEQKHYPKSLIAVEKGLMVNNLPKRFDVVLYNNHAKAVMLIECKAPEVKIDESTLHQALRYNSIIQAPYLLLTNGIDIYCGHINFSNGSFSYLNDIPDYNEMK